MTFVTYFRDERGRYHWQQVDPAGALVARGITRNYRDVLDASENGSLPVRCVAPSVVLDEPKLPVWIVWGRLASCRSRDLREEMADMPLAAALLDAMAWACVAILGGIALG